MVPMTEVIKGSSFHWTSQAQQAFEEVKAKLTQAPVLALPFFDKVFEVECDASSVGIGCPSPGVMPIGLFQREARRRQAQIFRQRQGVLCYCSESGALESLSSG